LTRRCRGLGLRLGVAAHVWCSRWRRPAAAGSCGVHPALRVTARHGGERIHLPGRSHSHALKHVLQALDLPPWQRRHLPLLRDQAGQVLAAGDRIHSADFAAWLQARAASLRWTPPGA